MAKEESGFSFKTLSASIFGNEDDYEDDFKRTSIPVNPRKRKASKNGRPDGNSSKEHSPSSPISSGSNVLDQVRRDFDEALRRAVPSRGRRRGLDQETEANAQAVDLIERMKLTANQDTICLSTQKIATYKITMLPEVIEQLSKRDLVEYLLDNRILDALRMWLEPYPDGSLPNIDVRKSILQILYQLPIDKIHLKESGIGKIIMYLYKCLEETRENKKLAYRLIDKWSRPIIGHSINYKDLSKGIQASHTIQDESGLKLPFVSPRSKGPDFGDSQSKQFHPYKNLLANMEKLKQKKSRK